MNIPTRTLVAEPTGTAFGRLAIALGKSNGDLTTAAEIAGNYRSTPHVAETLKKMSPVYKATVPAGSTQDPAWAGSLFGYGVDRDVALLFPGFSAFGQIEALARRGLFRVALPAETSHGTAGEWVGEGLSTPVNAHSLTGVGPMEVLKHQTLSAISKEVLRFGANAEQVVPNILLSGLGWSLDQAFLDPSFGATALRPASITYNIDAVGLGSPSTLSALDVDALLRSISTSGNGLVWIASPKTMARAIVMVGRNEPIGRFCGLPTVVSGNVPPGMLVLLDADELVIASGGYDLEISTNAAIQMSDAPTNQGIAPTATTLVSLFQVNAIGYRFGKYVNWVLAHAGAVAYTEMAV